MGGLCSFGLKCPLIFSIRRKFVWASGWSCHGLPPRATNGKFVYVQYWREIDTLSKMPDVSSASEFLLTLNEIHPSLSFTVKLEDNGKLPFLGMVIIRNSPRLDTKVYVKPTDTGLLLHYQSHVDVRYKHSLLNTMLNLAFKPSSNWQFFH